MYDLFSGTFSRTNCCNQSYASSNVLLPNLAKMMVSREEVIDHLKGTMSEGEGSCCSQCTKFFKTFHYPKLVKIGIRSYGLYLGTFESQGDGSHRKR